MARRQPAEVRRGRILDAATSLFLREGLERTSMEAVATAADIAKGTIYLYFPSRAELLVALRQRYAEQLAGRARKALAVDRPWTAASLTASLQDLLATLSEYLFAHRRVYHVLFRRAGVSEEETMAPLRELLRSSLLEASEDRALDRLDADTLMRFLLDGLHGGLLPLLRQPKQGRTRVMATLNEVIRRILASSGS